jgi:hypothetical protein
MEGYSNSKIASGAAMFNGGKTKGNKRKSRSNKRRKTVKKGGYRPKKVKSKK